MAQLYFKYGTMNSGKSIEILKVAHNYEEQGKPVVIMTSALDNRDEIGVVSSRIGMRGQAVPIDDKLNVYDYIDELDQKPYCILIDEAQFLSKKNIYDFARVVDELKVPVMAFGFKISYLKVVNTCFYWLTRLKKLKRFVGFVVKKQRWF